MLGCPHCRQAYELLKEEVFEDLTSEVGLLKALGLTLRLVHHGLLYGAIPCESYSFMSSATHRRTASEPWGKSWPFVLVGSICATRFAALALVATVRGGMWFVENPAQTALPFVPPIQLLLRPTLKPRMVKWPDA